MNEDPELEVRIQITEDDPGNVIAHLLNRDDVIAWVQQKMARVIQDRWRPDEPEAEPRAFEKAWFSDAERRQLRTAAAAVPRQVQIPPAAVEYELIEEFVLVAICPERPRDGLRVVVVP